ncbi:hypothetical protein V1514DRAFT_360096 [Lipomyces japonicus]|uniref:uncharacterized protein n=1 Tax=Lipomyces japonicus TaxID=56871 RepID=UPI0034CD44DD
MHKRRPLNLDYDSFSQTCAPFAPPLDASTELELDCHDKNSKKEDQGRARFPSSLTCLNIHAPPSSIASFVNASHSQSREYRAFESNSVKSLPDTLDAICKYLNCGALEENTEINSMKSSDSDKENIDPAEDKSDVFQSQSNNKYMADNSDLLEFQASLYANSPPSFDVSLTMSEIEFHGQPVARLALSTSTMKRNASNEQLKVDNVVQEQDQTEKINLVPRDVATAAIPSITSHRRFIIANFFTTHYFKRKLTGKGRIDVKINIDTENGFIGGSSLPGEIVLRVKKLKQGKTIFVANFELILICYEESKNAKKIIDLHRLLVLSNFEYSKAGQDALKLSPDVKLPVVLGPGYFKNYAYQIRYMLVAKLIADYGGKETQVNVCKEIKFFNLFKIGRNSFYPAIIRQAEKQATFKFSGNGPVLITVSLDQDYHESGTLCYVQTTTLNCCNRTISKLKMRLIQSIEYLQGFKKWKTDETVVSKSVVSYYHSGWPLIESGSKKTFTSSVQIPRFAISIDHVSFKANYFVEVAVGGYLGQYVTARLPIKILYKLPSIPEILATTACTTNSGRQPCESKFQVHEDMPAGNLNLDTNADVQFSKNFDSVKVADKDEFEPKKVQNVKFRNDEFHGDRFISPFSSVTETTSINQRRKVRVHLKKMLSMQASSDRFVKDKNNTRIPFVATWSDQFDPSIEG